MSRPPRIVRNDWSGLRVPELGDWRPTLPVSVVIPAYNCQASLDLALAALARQTYPAELLEVLVVDDGSAPALALPAIRPATCRLLRVGDGAGWGRANALHLGAATASGEVLHWLDADMVVDAAHVEAQARWHHQLPYAVTLGWKRFVDLPPDGTGWPSPEELAGAAVAGGLDQLFSRWRSTSHDYVEQEIARTDRLRDGDHLTFLAHVGATASVRRGLYERAGELNTGLRLGEDTEFGYRLAQAGAVFVPEPQARSWHLGTTHMMRHERELQRYNRPFLADLMPQPRWLRRAGGSGWSVPLVLVVVEASGHPLELVRAAVDAILRGGETDLRVALVGPWGSVGGQRTPPLTDPQLELRLIAATYQSDPRVELVERPPRTGFPSPFLLEVPVAHGLTPPAVGRLLDVADRHQVGLVQVAPFPGDPAGQVRLWRTAAPPGAAWVYPEGGSPVDQVAELHGARQVRPEQVGVVDLSRHTPGQVAPGAPAVWAAARSSGRWLPTAVEVAGARSLARATGLVARLALARAWARARSMAARRPSRRQIR